MKWLKILLGAVIALGVVAVMLELFLNPMIRRGVNTVGPRVLGVPVELQGADISLAGGRAALEGLRIGNPPGFHTPQLLDLGSIRIRLSPRSAFSDTLIIHEIAIEGLELTYEQGLRQSNLGALIESLSGPEEDPAPEKKPPESKKKEKQIVIEKLTIRDSRMNFSLTGAAALTGGKAIPLPLPPITLTDLGKEKEGIRVVEVIERILTEIARAAGTAIGGSAKVLGLGVGAAGEGLATGGEGAVETGKAVVEGVTEAGKALGDAATEAGKAVGETLKKVNPFKK